jgi:hypothetical protein
MNRPRIGRRWHPRDAQLRRPRGRLLSRERVLERAFGRYRPADAAEHVDEGAQRDRHLSVAGIVEEEAVEGGDQSSSTRTSCPERRNGSARDSIVYAIPNPSTAARTAKSVSLTMIRPSTEIRTLDESCHAARVSVQLSAVSGRRDEKGPDSTPGRRAT